MADNQSLTEPLHIRLPWSLMEQIKAAAQREQRTISAMVRIWLEQSASAILTKKASK
jgi:hypothetical protein